MVAWQAQLRFGGSLIHHTSGGFGSEPGTAVLGTFTFKSTTTAPFDQLTLADVQNYTQPINFGISSYKLTQWLYAGFVQDSIRVRRDLTIDLGLRYDRQTLTDATKDFAPRVGFGWHPGGDSRLSIRGGYGMYYTQIQSNLVASYLVSGLDGLTTYTATPGQFGFPTCLTGSCLPLSFDPKTLPPSQLPARDITIQAGRAVVLRDSVREVRAELRPAAELPRQAGEPAQPGGVHRRGARGRQGIVRRRRLRAPALDRPRSHRRSERPVALRSHGARPGQNRGRGQCHASHPAGERRRAPGQRADEPRASPITTACRRRSATAATRSMYAAVSYTLSKATNTTEPDGNGISPNQSNIARLGEVERGPSVLDQRHRAVITFSYQLPFNITAGTLTQFASARPFNATTGMDNNGDGANNDRPVINGAVIGKSAFRGTADLRRGTLRRRAASSRRSAQHPAPDRGLQSPQSRELPRPRPDRRTATRARRTRRSVSSSAVGTGDERDPGVRQYRPAADVPVAGAVHLLATMPGGPPPRERRPVACYSPDTRSRRARTR